MRFVRVPCLKEYEEIGCKYGQNVIQQVHESDGVSWMYVYDAKTENFIGRIHLKLNNQLMQLME